MGKEIDKAAQKAASGSGSGQVTYICASGLMAEILIGHPIEEGYTTDPRHPTLRRGAHVVALTCWSPPTATPSEAEMQAALEAELTRVTAEDDRLAAQAAALKAGAADRARLVNLQRRVNEGDLSLTMTELTDLARSRNITFPPSPAKPAGDTD